ncbi:MAG: hypothetical protein COW00_10330 [Bdellovibrio sp. CG12_big_fil_rev_8_21_14_0_65_39_13]|nr:MAG: hypothetical protein COW78_00985 [Bdellovibrio sp. CG22_combo_CG10-13_8_21_14_all_39_27]PIQ59508.1 MAG: hypothetical protein COW00_10330 [Bdellovibrio sp. CG12_big_fil_rev_8_21_14_0_65_39_13]PIR33488.1 MAG: hypothetical protein COV37_16155 [Bdellovibrio sp. CG11_big_fil_rev_8_21_14_0_20_39_38]PJB52829.1 MAG: hypothetical protein CO099_10560 [Bdellovibrio sp. CG_4_9_14_3_um_filter_39_7]
MDSILNLSALESNQTLTVALLAIAFIRVFIEVLGIHPEEWPVSKFLAKSRGQEWAQSFHRKGLFLSIGFILLFAPGILLSH